MSDTQGLSSEVLSKAEVIVKERYHCTNLDHPAVAKMYELAVTRLAKELAVNPKKGEEKVGDFDPFTEKKSSDVSLDLETIKLPKMPQVFIKLQDVINDPDSSANDLAKIISLDPGLSSCLLRMVNSALYGFPSQIETVSRAVTVLGMKQLKTLVMGALVLDMFKNPPKVINVDLFWKHSLAVGFIARTLATFLKRDNTERYFVAGLLHDIGRLALFMANPDLAEVVQAKGMEQNVILCDVEKDLMGVDHSKFGADLIRKWSFPETLACIVENHHIPNSCEAKDEASIIHVSDVIAKGFGIGASGQFTVPPLNAGVWDDLKIPLQVLDKIATGIDERLESVFSVFVQNN